MIQHFFKSIYEEPCNTIFNNFDRAYFFLSTFIEKKEHFNYSQKPKKIILSYTMYNIIYIWCHKV